MTGGLLRGLWQGPQILAAWIFLVVYGLLYRRKIRLISWEGACVTAVPDRRTRGMSLGPYLFIHMPPDQLDKALSRPLDSDLLLHEFGHWLDSLRLGPFYLAITGLPSLWTAWRNKPVYRHHRILWSHNLSPWEMRANRLAARYFGSRYGLDWSVFLPRLPRSRADWDFRDHSKGV
ncbi:MAG: hypothetical protein GXO27_03845 [Chlorobi bacterium]|nr:hypothetical protein [Chlorobiota bacterium]